MLNSWSRDVEAREAVRRQNACHIGLVIVKSDGDRVTITHLSHVLLPSSGVLSSRQFVGWLVRSFLTLVVVSKSTSQIWHRNHRCSAYAPNFTIKFWEVKVKVQGQNKPLYCKKIDRNFACFAFWPPIFLRERPPNFWTLSCDSDHVAKFRGDRPRDLGDLAV